MCWSNGAARVGRRARLRGGSGSPRRGGCAWTRSPGLLPGSRRHFAARLRAPPADLRACGHVGILAHPVALVRAALADGGAGGAGVAVHVRAAHHEIRAGAADLGAVEQQANGAFIELGRAFPPEMAGSGLQANAVAVGAVLYAALHGVGALGGAAGHKSSTDTSSAPGNVLPTLGPHTDGVNRVAARALPLPPVSQ